MGDWVVQNETWNGYDLVTGTGVDYRTQVINDPHEAWQLTTWLDNSSGTSESWRMPEQGTHRAVHTRGHIHWTLAPTNLSGTWNGVWNRDWGAVINFRIGVVMQQPDLPSVTMPSGYDLNTPQAANDEYVWSYQTILANISNDEWSGQPAARTRWHGTIPVVAKYNRTISPPLVMGLHVGFDQISDRSAWYQDMTDRVQLFWRPQLRTFVQT